MDDDSRIGIIGCGNMGLALARRLLAFGHTVVLGSRRPERHRHNATSVEIISIEECIHLSSILFIAIHADHYDSILKSLLSKNSSVFDRKIVIELSNQTTNDGKFSSLVLSNAERLQFDMPNAFIVKGFNTISSYAMENTIAGEPRCVYVASNSSIARERVMSLAREIGFESHSVGPLRAARSLESYNLSLFPQWKVPLVVTLIIFFTWELFLTYKKFISSHKTSGNHVFANVTNKVVCATAVTLLAIVYMPSNLAAIFQLSYGTKLRRFPSWLDKWLLSRKQLGLSAFAFGLCHAILSLLLMSPDYYERWYQPAEPIMVNGANQTQIKLPTRLMSWNGELAALFGVLTIFTLSILAIASIPAIGNLLNWREWQFIQSKLGTFALVFATGHIFSMSLSTWIRLGFVEILSSIGFPTVILPVITLLLKFILCLPCLSERINRIRRGEELRQTP